MRRLLPLILLVLLVGCVPPPTIDPAVKADLYGAAVATVDAMALPADQRPSEKALQDAAGLLAIQSPPQRQEQIRGGGVDALSVINRARDSMLELDRVRPGLKAPAMLVWLVEHPDQLDRRQLLLVDALTAQLRREAHLDK